jgi:hypothetical protein
MACGIMPDESRTPVPVFEESTGRLYLEDGTARQVIARFGEDGNIYVWWRWGRREVPLTLEQIHECHRVATE